MCNNKHHTTRVLWNYVLWRLVLDMTPHLSRNFQASRHEFQKVLLGIQSDRNRWNLCIDWTNKRLGMAVGALFIKENFNPESKVRKLCHKDNCPSSHCLIVIVTYHNSVSWDTLPYLFMSCTGLTNICNNMVFL